MFSFGEACSIISGTTATSISGFLWKSIVFLWPWHWLWITMILFLWIVWEINTRHGKAHYNSKNGFSPTFNIFVGSGSYLLIQAILFLTLTKLFGEAIYCYLWPFPVHYIIFRLNGWLLHYSGFWPYLKKSSHKKYYKYRKRF